MQNMQTVIADCKNHEQDIHKLHEKISVFECKSRRCTKLPLRVKRSVKYLREENRLKVTENKEFVRPGKETHGEITYRSTSQFID
jgi:hypothetical protein